MALVAELLTAAWWSGMATRQTIDAALELLPDRLLERCLAPRRCEGGDDEAAAHAQFAARRAEAAQLVDSFVRKMAHVRRLV